MPTFANLTLARTLRRERELAVRSALGAGAGQLRLQLFAESLVLALGGAVFGLLLAFGLLDALRAYTSRFTNRTGEIAIDGGVLLFTLAVAVATAVAFSVLPGLVPARAAGSSTGGPERVVPQSPAARRSSGPWSRASSRSPSFSS